MKRLTVAQELVLAGLLLAGVARGCGSSTCASDGDCGSSEVCAFTIGDCSGQGTCQSFTNQCNGEGSQACSCDGTTVAVPCGYPGGSPFPSKTAGPCPIPAGTRCNTPEDCDPRALCAFPADAGCQAAGICVTPDFSCTVDNPTGCGCDGLPVGGACIYGAGYAAAPIQFYGSCPTPDGGVTPEGGEAGPPPDAGAE